MEVSNFFIGLDGVDSSSYSPRKAIKLTFPIVFVHLGTPPPKVLLRNLEIIHLDFPGSDLHVVTDRDWGKKFPSWVSSFQIPQDGHARRIVGTPHSTTFRRGYWLFVSQRLGALADWHDEHPSMPLLHIEGDIMLLPNFPFEKFETLEKLSWLRFSEDADMPGLLYSPSSTETAWLADRVTFFANGTPSKTDMQSLRKVALEDPSRISYLPGFRQLCQDKFADELSMEQSLDEFGGIFDAAPIGQYLAGIDPRNSWGLRRLGHRSASAIRYEAVQFTSVSGTIYASLGHTNQKIQIFNLHLHSKDLSLFSFKSRRDNLEKLIKAASQGRSLFSWSGYFGAVRQLMDAGVAKIFEKFIK